MPGGSGKYSDIPLRQTRPAFEADYIQVEQHQGNVSRAARALGLSAPRSKRR
jgi:hypothetical protein